MVKKMFKLKKGINHCTNEEYHSDKNYLSSSVLKTILKSPEEYKKVYIDGDSKSVSSSTQKIFDEGTYAHSLILEPENIADEFSFYTGFRKSGKDWELFKAANTGKIILSKPQKHRVESWVETYKSLPAAVNLVSGGFAEYSLAGELSGVPIKVRADYINIDKGYVADVKTTSYDTDVESFRFVVENLSYDLSAALYTEMFELHYNKPFDFYFIVLGKKDGMCEVYKMSDESMNKGKIMVRKALGIYKKCLESGDWTSGTKSDIIDDESYEILEV